MSYSSENQGSTASRSLIENAWILALVPSVIFTILGIIYEGMWSETLFLIFFIIAGVFMFATGLLGVFIDSWIIFSIPPLFYVILGLVHNIRYTRALYDSSFFASSNCDTLCIILLALLGAYLVTAGLIGSIRSQRRGSTAQIV